MFCVLDKPAVDQPSAEGGNSQPKECDHSSAGPDGGVGRDSCVRSLRDRVKKLHDPRLRLFWIRFLQGWSEFVHREGYNPPPRHPSKPGPTPAPPPKTYSSLPRVETVTPMPEVKPPKVGAADRGLPTLYRTEAAAVLELVEELRAAQRAHPNWPAGDVVHAVSIMIEEALEAIQAANDYRVRPDPATLERLRQELIQTGAMCLRCLISFPKGGEGRA